ncbi:alpha,alpha-phosphotrehalase [Photobacterium sp. 1_MG-2023]|uniref:alpha,alpha-phosphotrehalase n=1 Tax=Photobacterium sp. 1_MG-2023 TaxID=3062646 RepID=UPI0026E31370|nr:alpha,alpha-phosphotrehalase [Photobacterium sp. 1_MG-2023]MDO6705004.1 alpha,alpha-phosphotrehalase [Photobacterium sp. 1_MG-2023]
MKQTEQPWWRTATIYQIYPKSFADSGNQGTGDIKGIIQRLPYLQTLGIDAIWLTPVYASPMIDNGYDISDYYSINPDFGTMADFDRLLDAARQRGIRIIMDIVVNHTSTEHAWFQQALSDKNSPYRDYYIWQDAVDGREPNNWQSKFGGNAWEWHEATQQYYLHLFAKEQADLNWENPAVREEVKQVIRFWAEKGVDGFRLDVINLISKQQDFPDDNQGDGRRFYTDGPRVHEFLQEISAEVFQKYGSVTVGEMSSTTLEHCQQYSARDGRELSMVFNFHHLKVDYPNGEKWQLAPMDFLALKALFSHWQQGLHVQGWGALFWCNHDQPRVVSRFGDDGVYRDLSAKMLATSLHLMQGTPYIYQGEELGMTNPGFTEISQYRDVESLNMYRILTETQGMSSQQALAILVQRSRDNSRTPMQWDNSAYAGFTAGVPWIDVAENYPQINAAQALADDQSVFHYYRQLIAMRKQLGVIVDGDYTDLLPADPALHVYRRQTQHQTLICLNNYSAEPAEFSLQALSSLDLSLGQVVLSNYDDETALQPVATGCLRPYESRVWLFGH